MRRLTTMAVAALAAAAAFPAASVAGPPRDVVCENLFGGGGNAHVPAGRVCFEWDGDDQWVLDTKRNGWSVRAKVRTNDRGRPGGGYYYKTRYCANRHGARSRRWEECRFNHREDRCVRWWMDEIQGAPRSPFRASGGRWSSWYDTSTGAELSRSQCVPR